MDEKQLGDLIRAAREEKGWTQNELAQKYSCSQAYISDLERGRVVPDFLSLLKLLRCLGKDMHYLLPPPTSEFEDLDRSIQGLKALPAGPIRDETIAGVKVLSDSARRRVHEQNK